MVLTSPCLAAAQSMAQRDFKSSAGAEQKVVHPDSAVRLNRLIIKFRSEVPDKATAHAGTFAQERVHALNARHPSGAPAFAGTTLRYLKSVSANTHVAQTSHAMGHAELNALAQAVAQDPRVEYAEVDERVYPHFVPNGILYATLQENLKSPLMVVGAANLPSAWGRSVGGVPVSGAGVTVAVLDSGYRPHADLVANVLGGYDFISPDGSNNYFTANDGDGRDASALDPGDWNTQAHQCDVENSSWHGTRVAGIIGAVGNNHSGVIGVAYRASILPVRVLGVCGGYTSDTAAALQWAVGLTVPGVPVNPNVAKVINMSFGRSGSCSPTYQAAITAARNTGAVIVVSTGNLYSRTTITQPANCAGVIAVTAHTSTGDLADYANVGFGTTLSAPGNYIRTTSNTGTTVPAADSYSTESGTSFSAPQVAGVAALLIQIKPGISPAEVQNHLVSSAGAFPVGTYCATRTACGAGMLDAFKAVTALLVSQGIANAAPVLHALPTQYVLPGGALQFTAIATDAEGDDVFFNGTGLPAGAAFNFMTGVFSWPKAQPAGDYTFVIQPTDGVSLGASVAIKISVTTAIPVEPVVAPVVAPAPATGSSGGGALGWVELLASLVLLLASRYGAKPRNTIRQSSPVPACRHPAP
jgi:serine protease